MQPEYYQEDIAPNDSISTSSSSPRRGELERISSTNPTGIALIPKLDDFDIACSQDQSFANHSGNRIYRQYVEATKLSYHAAKTKAERIKITKDFVTKLQSTYGSRFLKKHSNGMWFEIAPSEARDKVGHAIRFALRRYLAATAAGAGTAGAAAGGGGAGAGAGDMRSGSSSSSSSSNSSNCSTTAHSETSHSEEATAAVSVAAAAAAASTTTTTTNNDHSEPPSPSFESTKEININELLAEPLYLDEYESGSPSLS